MLVCRKEKNAEGKRGSAQLFHHPLGDIRHPLKITLPPPGRNPENAPETGATSGTQNKRYKNNLAETVF